jgi:hypothetical protein
LSEAEYFKAYYGNLEALSSSRVDARFVCVCGGGGGRGVGVVVVGSWGWGPALLARDVRQYRDWIQPIHPPSNVVTVPR